MNADNILFRASSIGHLMTEAKKAGELSEGTKTHLIDKYVSVKYGREQEIESKFMTKGNEAEEDSITLFSRFSKKLWFKNDMQLENEFISGTPDLIPANEVINAASHVVDLKTSWSIYTFFRAGKETINKMYYWQLMAYMALTGAKTGTLAYCLVNTPAHLIDDEKRRLMYKMNVATDNDERYLERAANIEKNMIFDMPKFLKDYPNYPLLTDPAKWTFDVPLEESIIKFELERDQAAIDKMYERIKEARKWMDVQLFKIENLKEIAA